MEVISKIIFINTYAKERLSSEGEKRGFPLYRPQGQVKVCLYDEDAGIHTGSRSAKTVFLVSLPLLDELPRSANVITLEDSELLIIRRHDFTSSLWKIPRSPSPAVFSRRLREADERIKWLAFLSVEGRALKYLLGIGEKEGEGKRLHHRKRGPHR